MENRWGTIFFFYVLLIVSFGGQILVHEFKPAIAAVGEPVPIPSVIDPTESQPYNLDLAITVGNHTVFPIKREARTYELRDKILGAIKAFEDARNVRVISITFETYRDLWNDQQIIMDNVWLTHEPNK